MRYAIVVVLAVMLSIGVWYVRFRSPQSQPVSTENSLPSQSNERTKIIAENLDTPWGLAFLPSGDLLVTERSGTVRLIENGVLSPLPVATITAVKEIGEGGLLGIALDPQFSSTSYVYLYYTYSSSGNSTLNRVVRMKYMNKTLVDEQIVINQVPGAANHNGGRIKFGPDGYLYVATGDAQEPSLAQSNTSTAGKILRTTPEGKPVPGNPFNTLIYSYGHRNPQGLTWNNEGLLFATEHGRSGIQSGLDEINQIERGKNYGWPEIEGDETRSGMEIPVSNSGNTTWAPAGVAFFNGSLYFGGLRGQSLYKAVLNGDEVIEIKEYFKGEFGRIRDVVVGPDSMLYITTSNKDGRGVPDIRDDKVIRINPSLL